MPQQNFSHVPLGSFEEYAAALYRFDFVVQANQAENETLDILHQVVEYT